MSLARRSAALACLSLLTALGVARADIVSGGDMRVSFQASISPKALPRTTPAPIALRIAARVTPIEGRRPQALRRVRVEVNGHALATTKGLPRCPWGDLLSTTSKGALRACGDSLIGSGRFSSHIDIPEQAPFPALGRMLAFNAVKHGRPVLAVHVYGKTPVSTSEVLPMSIRRAGKGAFGPIVTVQMPNVGNEWGYVNGFELTLKRSYRYHGHSQSVFSASCPAPPGVDQVPFRAARGTFELADGTSLTRVVGGSCRVAARSGRSRR